MKSLRALLAALRAPLGQLYALIVEALELHIRRLRRRSVRYELDELRGEVRRLGSASVESLTYLSAELRELAGLIDGRAPDSELEVVEAPFAYRCLAAVKPPARVLTVGIQKDSLPRSLTTMGYEVRAVSATDELERDAERFDAVVCRATPEEGELAREMLGELLAPDGLLILAVHLGDPDREITPLSQLFANWHVVEEALIERHNGDVWTPASNGATVRPAVALLAASPPRSDR